MPIFKASLLPFLAAALLVSAGWIGSIAQGGKDSGPVGVWRGDSKCVTGAPSCHDEQVVYYIESISGKTDEVKIRADKIVDGKAITMGVGPWTYDAGQQALSFRWNQQQWHLILHGEQMEGALTLADGVVFRRMTLVRDRAQAH